MGEGGDFIAHERRVATYVRDALRQSSVRQVIRATPPLMGDKITAFAHAVDQIIKGIDTGE